MTACVFLVCPDLFPLLPKGRIFRLKRYINEKDVKSLESVKRFWIFLLTRY